MTRRLPLFSLSIVVVLGLGACTGPAPITVDPGGIHTTIDRTFLERGGYVRWHHASGRIAYQRQGKDGYYDVYVADGDGTHERALTKGNALLPGKNAGAHAWHSSGKILVVVAEKATHDSLLPFGWAKTVPIIGESYAALPGFGGYSDLWAVSADGARAWRLTDLPNSYDSAVLLPNFSPDGRKLAWAQRVKRPDLGIPKLGMGTYVIKVADFQFDDERGPELSNVRTYQPGGPAFYEPTTFTPDGSALLYSSTAEATRVFQSQIYRLDLSDGTIVRLTNAEWNEHPSYTPDGRHVMYMSNYQSQLAGTDWWIMDPDGTDKCRLTFLNEKGHPHSTGTAVWAGTPAWSADGTWFYGDVQTNLVTQETKNIVVRTDALRHGCR